MFFPQTVTASAPFFRRIPLQAGQGVMLMKVSYSCLEISDAVSRYLRSTLFTRPSKATG